MKPGDRVVHRASGNILDILTVQGIRVACKYIWVSQKEVSRTGIMPGDKRVFLKDELQGSNG